MKNLKPYLLALFAIATLLAGLLVGWIRFFLTPSLVKDSIWYIKHFFGPNHPPEYTYNALYNYAIDITEHRNSIECFYQSIICILLIIVSIICFLWIKDIRRTSRQTKSTKGDKRQTNEQL